MPKMMSTQEFISKAKAIHGDRYDYSLLEYNGQKYKVKIICKIHGIFDQYSYHHLNGMGCRKCGYEKLKLTNVEFITKANEIHNNKYDYSLCEYNGTFSKLKIICRDHGQFEQTANNHLNGYGCICCANNSFRLTADEFIKRANFIHHNKYDYSQAIYINLETKITIACPDHGLFDQAPESHLRGSGCRKCSITKMSLSLDDFIKKSNIIHNNKYNYSSTVYMNTDSKVIVTCPLHGDFLQQANSHLNGHGCPRCSHLISKGENQWLDLLKIKKENRQITLRVNNKNYRVDAFDPETNTIYEFYGDFWHGNPKRFNPNDINIINNKSFIFLYERTLEKEKDLRMSGYNIVSIWENDFNKMKENNLK